MVVWYAREEYRVKMEMNVSSSRAGPAREPRREAAMTTRRCGEDGGDVVVVGSVIGYCVRKQRSIVESIEAKVGNN